LPLNSGNSSHRLNVSTVAALTAATVDFGFFYNILLIFGSILVPVVYYKCARIIFTQRTNWKTLPPGHFAGGGGGRKEKRNEKGRMMRRDCSVRNFWLGKLATLSPIWPIMTTKHIIGQSWNML